MVGHHRARVNPTEVPTADHRMMHGATVSVGGEPVRFAGWLLFADETVETVTVSLTNIESTEPYFSVVFHDEPHTMIAMAI